MNLRQVGILLFRTYALGHLLGIVTSLMYFPAHYALIEHYIALKNFGYVQVLELDTRIMWARIFFEGLIAFTFWVFADALTKICIRGIEHLRPNTQKETPLPQTDHEEKFGV